jgi:hypothetical protein
LNHFTVPCSAMLITRVPFNQFTLERFGGTAGRYWLIRRELLTTDSV